MLQVSARQEKTKYTIRASFLEIYNEQVRDLWNPSSGALSIREYPPGYWRGFYVEDLYIFECTNVDDMLFMLAEGMSHRAVGSHSLNKDSSRSHSMLTFYLESEEEENGDPYVKFGKISFVDLAGSERLKETQGVGERQDFQATFRSRARMKGDEMLKETGNINKSLFTLGKVISALGGASKAGAPHYVPYRDSKLTKLLMDSLGGASKALMFACCSPADSYLEETLNTLQYAARTRNITNKPAVQVDPHEELVRELRKELKILQHQNGRLHDALTRCGKCADCPPSIKALVEEALASINDGSEPGSPVGTPPDNDEAGEHQQSSRTGRNRRDRSRRGSEMSEGDYLDEPPRNNSRRGRGNRSSESRGGRRRRVDAHAASAAEMSSLDEYNMSSAFDNYGEDYSGREEYPGRRGQRSAGGARRNSRRRGSEREFVKSEGRVGLSKSSPALDDASAWLEAAPRSSRGPRKRVEAQQGGTDDPFLPDSLLDGSSDWKNELDDEARELYRELGLALYKATSQEEMSAAMKGLQQFERDHREAAMQRVDSRGGKEGSAVDDPDEAFRSMAMSFYRDDSSTLGAGRVLAAQRRRSQTPSSLGDGRALH